MSPELRLRIVSGIVMAVVVLAATWAGGTAFVLLSCLIGLLVYYEWSTMTKLAERDFRGLAIGWGGMVVIVLATLFADSVYAVGALLLFTVALLVLAALRDKNWWSPGGVFYAGLTIITLSEIRDNDPRGLVAMLFIFATVWASDIFAYFVGRAIGGPKLAPRISPGKTWSGAIGGALAATIAGTLLVSAFFVIDIPRVALVAFALSVCSQIGDLFESFIKRRFGVKDSSHLIPGHGGVMDRVDGLVFACFAAFAVAVLLSLASDAETSSLGGILLGF